MARIPGKWFVDELELMDAGLKVVRCVGLARMNHQSNKVSRIHCVWMIRNSNFFLSFGGSMESPDAEAVVLQSSWISFGGLALTCMGCIEIHIFGDFQSIVSFNKLVKSGPKSRKNRQGVERKTPRNPEAFLRSRLYILSILLFKTADCVEVLNWRFG